MDYTTYNIAQIQRLHMLTLSNALKFCGNKVRDVYEQTSHNGADVKFLPDNLEGDRTR